MAQLLLGGLVTALIGFGACVGNWLRSDIVELRQEQNKLKSDWQKIQIAPDQLNTQEARIDLFIQKVNIWTAQQFEDICQATRGHYDANDQKCLFDDGRAPLIYEPLEK